MYEMYIVVAGGYGDVLFLMLTLMLMLMMLMAKVMAMM